MGDKVPEMIEQLNKVIEDIRCLNASDHELEIFMSEERIRTFSDTIFEYYQFEKTEKRPPKDSVCNEIFGIPVRIIPVKPLEFIYVYWNQGLMAVLREGQQTVRLWEELSLKTAQRPTLVQ